MIKKKIKSILPQSVQVFFQNKHFYKSLPNKIKTIISELNKNDICIDCGGNLGMATYLFASYKSKVFCFEPDPGAYQHLEKRFKNNNLITIYNKAVGIKNGKCYLYQHPNINDDPERYSEASSLIPSKPNVSKKGIEIEMINLSHFLQSIEKVKILKIDIEGYEAKLIPMLIKDKCLDKVDHVFLETHEKKWPELRNDLDKMFSKIRKSVYNTKFHFDWP